LGFSWFGKSNPIYISIGVERDCYQNGLGKRLLFKKFTRLLIRSPSPPAREHLFVVAKRAQQIRAMVKIHTTLRVHCAISKA
jgi:hypothetical protein